MKVLQEMNKDINFLFFSDNIGKVYIYFFGTFVKEKRLASIIFNFNFGMKITAVQKLYNL